MTTYEKFLMKCLTWFPVERPRQRQNPILDSILLFNAKVHKPLSHISPDLRTDVRTSVVNETQIQQIYSSLWHLPSTQIPQWRLEFFLSATTWTSDCCSRYSTLQSTVGNQRWTLQVGLIANEIRKYWIALHDFLGNYISVLILNLYCHVLCSFSLNYSWLFTVLPLALFFFINPDPVFSFFTFSKIPGSPSPNSLTPFLMPPIFGLPVPVYSGFPSLGFFLLLRPQLPCIFFKCKRKKEAFSCLWELTSLNFILIFWSKEAGFF